MQTVLTMTESSTKAKNAEISRRILAGMSVGMTIQEAIDAVCGAGTFAKLAADLHAQMQGR